MSERLSILVLADDRRGVAETIRDHVAALRHYSRHNVQTVNPTRVRPDKPVPLDGFDVVVIHHSILVTHDQYLSAALRERIRQFAGLKVQFVQDEYRWPDAVTSAIRNLEIDVLFSLLNEEEIPRFYSERLPDVAIFPALAGYVPERLARLDARDGARPIDIGYRGRSMPFWLGNLAREKIEIGRGVLERAPLYGLRCDIGWAEKDRIYGRQWDAFLSSCRAFLGTESGASITDWDGTIERNVNAYLVDHPGATYEEVHAAILAPHEGNFPMQVVSPRVFEAIAHRTALVQFPGGYSGVVEPWVHYIPLEKDFSNMDEVSRLVRDERFVSELTSRAHSDVIGSGRYSYSSFVERFDEIVGERRVARSRGTQIPFVAHRIRERASVGSWLSPTPAWQAARGAGRTIAVGRIVLSSRPLRRLCWAWLRNVRARRLGREAVVADLVRLGILARISAGREGRPFTLSADFQPDHGRLTIATRLSGVAGEGPREVDVSRLRSLTWSHEGIDTSFAVPVFGHTKVRFAVGVGNPSFHSFDAFVELAREDPEAAADTLRMILGAGGNGDHAARLVAADG